MNKELKKLLEAVKNFNWTVTQEDGNVFDFGWYSPLGILKGFRGLNGNKSKILKGKRGKYYGFNKNQF